MSLSTEINKKPAETITDRKRVMGFGRYKDLTIEEVLQIDPQYLLWCQENIAQFDLNHDLLDEAEGGQRDTDEIINEIYADLSDNAGHVRD